MQVKTLLDVAVAATEGTTTLSGRRWYIEHLIISKVHANAGNITLKFNDNEHFSAYTFEEGKDVFSIPFPYVLENAETFKHTASAASVFRVALIGTEEDVS